MARIVPVLDGTKVRIGDNDRAGLFVEGHHELELVFPDIEVPDAMLEDDCHGEGILLPKPEGHFAATGLDREDEGTLLTNSLVVLPSP